MKAVGYGVTTPLRRGQKGDRQSSRRTRNQTKNDRDYAGVVRAIRSGDPGEKNSEQQEQLCVVLGNTIPGF